MLILNGKQHPEPAREDTMDALHHAPPRRLGILAPSTLMLLIIIVAAFVGCGTNAAATVTRAAEIEVLSTALAPTPPRFTSPSVPPPITIFPTLTTNPTVAIILNSQQAAAQATRVASCDSIRAEYRRNGWTLDLSKPYATLYTELQVMNGVPPDVNNRATTAMHEQYRRWLDACLG